MVKLYFVKRFTSELCLNITNWLKLFFFPVYITFGVAVPVASCKGFALHAARLDSNLIWTEKQILKSLGDCDDDIITEYAGLAH